MPFSSILPGGRPITIKDEGVPLTTNVGSIDFTGAGVTGSTVGDAVTETISGGGGGGGTWGSITGTLSNQTDLQTALDGKVDENTAITGATKTKVTYDEKGLVTAGADATTADIADSTNKRYVTDAQLTVLGNTSGTNTGDQTSIVGITGTKAQFDTAVTDGNFLYVGDITQYTDEMAQDAIGAMIDSTLVYTDSTPLLTRAALTGDVTAAQGSNATTIANDAVTFAKMQNIATGRLLGRSSASTGDVEELSVGTGLSLAGGTLSATGVPGGSNTQIQFNDGGSFGGDDDLTWNKTTNVLGINGNISFPADASATAHTISTADQTAANTASSSISLTTGHSKGEANAGSFTMTGGNTYGSIAYVNVYNPGTGYVVNDVLNLTGVDSGGTGAQLTVDTVGGAGEILTYHISTEGNVAYTINEVLTVTGGTGTGAEAQVTAFATAGTAGGFLMRSGTGGGAGDFEMYAGDGGFGDGGSFFMGGGTAYWGDGGSFTLNGGNGGSPNGSDAVGGYFQCTGGQGANAGAGGGIYLQGGTGGPTDGTGGEVSITAGNGGGSNGNGGNLYLLPGLAQGAGTNGTINLQDPLSNLNAIIDTSALASTSKTFTFPNQTGQFMVKVAAPASASASGVAGTYSYDSNYFYVCTATDTWKRVAISTW